MRSKKCFAFVWRLGLMTSGAFETAGRLRGSAVGSPRRSRLKPQWAEALPIHADFLLGDPFAEEPRGNRRKQDAAAKVSGGHQQACEVGRPEDRKMIGGVGSQSRPGFLDARILQSGSQLDGGGKDFLDAPRRDALIEADVLDRGARKDPSVVSR